MAQAKPSAVSGVRINVSGTRYSIGENLLLSVLIVASIYIMTFEIQQCCKYAATSDIIIL